MTPANRLCCCPSCDPLRSSPACHSSAPCLFVCCLVRAFAVCQDDGSERGVCHCSGTALRICERRSDRPATQECKEQWDRDTGEGGEEGEEVEQGRHCTHRHEQPANEQQERDRRPKHRSVRTDLCLSDANTQHRSPWPGQITASCCHDAVFLRHGPRLADRKRLAPDRIVLVFPPSPLSPLSLLPPPAPSASRVAWQRGRSRAVQ